MSDISDFLDGMSGIEAQGNQYELNKKNEKFQKLVTKLQNIVRGVDHFLQHKLGVGLPSEWLERAGLKEPAKKSPSEAAETIREATGGIRCSQPLNLVYDFNLPADEHGSWLMAVSQR